MIHLYNISKSYSSKALFLNVNLLIKRGMRAGLVGRNGSGKTTLLEMLIGKESIDSGNIKKEKNLTIGYLKQEIIPGSKNKIIEEVLESKPEIIGLEKEILELSNKIAIEPNNKKLIQDLGDKQNEFDIAGGWSFENKAKKILGGLGFKEKQFNDKMDKLSGGWRMRVALASILLQSPDVIFLDEPTNHLDLEATIWLEKFLSDWKGSIIIISHDRTFLDRSVNHIIEIDLKRISLFNGNYTNYKKEKEKRLEQHKNAYKNQQKEIRDTEKFIERFRYKNTKASQVQSRIKKLEKMSRIDVPNENKSSIYLSIPKIGRSPQNLVNFKNVSKYYDSLMVFENLKLAIERNDKIGLVGANGAGKSTFLKLLAGKEKASGGNIEYGKDISISYYAQHQLDILDPEDLVINSLGKVTKGWSEGMKRSYLGSFLFSGEDVDKYVKVLSGGEKARLAMARVLAIPSHLLLLDEPTNHLDMNSRDILENTLSKYNGTIVCISHDRHFLNKVTNTTYKVSKNGVKVFKGNYDYYDWKSRQKDNAKQKMESQLMVERKEITYKEKKKLKNRITWINRRFIQLEKLIQENQAVLKNPTNKSNYDLLQRSLEKINFFETEYIALIEEKENIVKLDTI